MRSRFLTALLFLALSIPWTAYAGSHGLHEPEETVENHSNNPPMYCHSGIQVSLNEEGFAVILPQMLLVQTFPNYDQFTVTIVDPPLNTDTVTCDLVGMTIDVMVSDTSGNSCWTAVGVEDKLAPVVECDTAYLPCTVDPFNLPDSLRPARYSDNCTDSLDLTLTYTQSQEALDCSVDPYIMKITRRWTVTDESGRSSSCNQIILIENADIMDLELPMDTTFNCPAPSTDVSVTGEPTIGGQPFGNLCMWVYTFADDSLPKCGNSYIIRRTFMIADWCTGNMIMHTQDIHVIDETPPTVYCPNDVTIEAVSNCEGQYLIPDPNATDGCADDDDIQFTYRVDGVVTGQQLTGLSLGDHIITVIAYDPCFNVDSCTFTVTVIDTEPPVPVCNDVMITLGQDGTVTVPYGIFDFWYHDNCAVVDTMIRRVNDYCSDPNDLVYGDEVTFCCADLAGPVMVAIKVTDQNGNMNECMFNVTVKDNFGPMIICPPDMTIECTQVDDSLYFGSPIVNSSCPVELDSIEELTLDACGRGEITRTFMATSSTGNVISCVQTISIVNPFDFTNDSLMFPPDVTLTMCTPDTSTMNTGYPVILDNFCGNITLVYDDSIATPPNGCLTLYRTWDVFNACDSQAMFHDVQEIVMKNQVPPDVTAPTGGTYYVGANCDVNIDLPPVLLDDCSTDITVTNDYNNQGGDIDDVFIPGNYTITFSAENLCGLIGTDTTLLVVLDTISPQIICPVDVTLDCPADTSSAVLGLAIATDNCPPNPPVTYTDQVTPGLCDNTFTVIRTFTTTDASGNSATCQQTIVVQDITDPVITCPADVTLNCPADTSPSNTGTATATDECNTPVVTYSDAVTPGSCPDNFTVLRTWTATDPCGNSMSCVQTIVVQDITDPVITCPADVTLDCPADTTTANTGVATATEECSGPATITYSDAVTPGCTGTFTVVRTWTATDACGNDASCVQTIVVQDITDPVITCPADVTLDCPADTSTANTGVATATEECSGTPTIMYSDAVTPGCTGTFTVVRTWTATDACGNSASCAQTIVVQDITDPVITCPADVTLDCPADTTPANTGVATATEECSGTPIITYSDAVTPGCTGTFTVVRTWTATDACGNDASCVQTIVVQDITDPVITCPADVTLDCPADTSTANTGVATATEECSGTPTITYSDAVTPGCPGTFTVLRTWTATDACGNDASCVQTIIVQDITDPIISCPADVTLNCPADTTPANTGTATATDACNIPTITYSDAVTQGSCQDNFTILRTWTATDPCGNSMSCVQTIVVQDTTDPVITCPADVTLDCPADTSTANTGVATATEECSGPATITYSDAVTPGCPGTFTVLRTWTATDACGNNASCVQTIVVQDIADPVITCPADVTLDCPGDTSTANTGVATATEECSGPAAITYSDAVTPGCSGTFTVLRTWTATDACGNNASCVQTIVVQDITDPVITCPADVTLDCPADTTPANTGVATATEECSGPAAITYSDAVTPGCPGTFTVLRTWTATDACGNNSSCVQTIVVQDITDPVITCPADVTLDCPADTSTANTGVATATEECSGTPTIMYSDAVTPGCPGTFTVLRTWTATDACGNNASCVQTIVVQDVTDPVITCPADVTLDCPADTTTANTGVATATDDCNTPTIIYSDVVTPGSCPNTFSVVRTWTATDPCGNSVSCDQNIVVVDNTDPLITCPPDTTIDCMADTSPASTGMPIVSDECNNNVNLVYSDVTVAGQGDTLLVITRTWTVTDLCGNSASCDQTIVVADFVPPSITCPADITAYSTLDSCEIYVQVPLPNATDNCGVPSVTNNGNGNGLWNASGIYPLGTTTVTFIVTDGVGHVDSCSMTITVLDTVAPILICPPDMSINCSDSIFPLSQFGMPTASDNCPGGTLIEVDSLVFLTSCFDGQIDRIFTATDASGNVSTCTQIISIIHSPPLDSTDFIWPSPIVEEYGCVDFEDIPLPLPELNPSITVCGVINIDSTVTQIVPPTFGCMTWEVTYTVTDSCNYDPVTGAGRWTMVQTVGIFDTIAPVIVPIAPGTHYADSFCEATVTLADVTATDNCNPVTITNNSPFANSNGPNASGVYPGGTTPVTFYAEDLCGNVDSFLLNIHVTDTTAPFMICLKKEYQITDSLNVIIHVDTVITAFSDNCTSFEDITLTFDLNDYTDTLVEYDCNDVGMIFFEMVYSIDEQGNVDSCEAELGIDDPLHLCPSSINIDVGGRVTTALYDPIEDVEVELAMDHDTEMSDTEGDFMFADIPSNVIHRLDAYKDDPYLNGVTAYDLSLLMQHIAGIAEIDDPYLYYAADVNGDEKIDIRDVLELRKLLLGIQEELPIPSWTFYDAHYDLSSATNPFYYNVPEYVMVYHQREDMYDADFIGVKTADLDYSSDLGLTFDTRSGSLKDLTIGLPVKNTAGELLIPVYTDGHTPLGGGQFEIQWNGNGRVIDVIPNKAMHVEPVEINTQLLSRKTLRMAWVAEEEILDYGQPLVWLKVDTESDEIQMGDWTLNANFLHEVFDENGNKFGVELKVEKETLDVESTTFALYQNNPNPFAQSTVIQFSLPEDAQYELTFFDIKGSQLYHITQDGHAGMNQFLVTESMLGTGSGVIYYQLQTENDHAVKKMIRSN